VLWVNVLQQLVNGLQIGSIYALLALGYTMVYGIVKLINFAHGDVYMVGAFIGFFLAPRLGNSFLLTMAASMLGCALLGALIERVAYKPLRTAPRIAALTTAIGVSLFLENFVRLVIGPNPLPFPKLVPMVTYKLGGVYVSNIHIMVFAVSIALAVSLQYVVMKTRTGKAMRAVSFDKDTARLMGINVDNIISITFVIGSALAAAGGVLVGLAYIVIQPYMGIVPGLKAFVAAVLGGVGSIPGAVVGGLLMGVSETLVAGFLSSTYRDAVAFAILILVLLVRPEGLLGRSTGEKV
jgi:branched-chain amino acid transport system permease protein